MAIIQNDDWVIGETTDGEMFQGWVEASNGYRLEVYITKSDNDYLVGKTKRLYIHEVRKMEDSKLIDEGAIMNLIDMALDEQNEMEFQILTQRLQNLKRNKVTA